MPLCASSRGNQDAYDTNRMAEEFTHFFLDQAFSVEQQVQEFCQSNISHFGGLMDNTVIDFSTYMYMSVSHLFNFSLWVIFLRRYTQRSELLPCVPLFCLYHILTLSVSYYWTDVTAPWNLLILLIIYMKKLLDSDWLRAVQYKCNTPECKKCNSVQKV